MSKLVAGAGANLLSQHAKERNQDATVYVGNLDNQVTEDILWELFTQVARVQNVFIPRDKINNTHSAFGFVELISEKAAEYSINILNNTRLFGRLIRLNKASQKNEDVGANLFIGHLDRNVDKLVLDSVFSRFGRIIYSNVIHPEDETKLSYGFVHYDCFEASDYAIKSLDGQFIENQQVSVSYAKKKDGNGELHGSLAERELANSNPDKKPYTIPVMHQPLPPARPPPQPVAAPQVAPAPYEYVPAPYYGGYPEYGAPAINAAPSYPVAAAAGYYQAPAPPAYQPLPALPPPPPQQAWVPQPGWMPPPPPPM